MSILTIPYSCLQLAVSPLNFSHSNRYMVVSHCGFNFHFPINSWCWVLSSTYLPFILSSLMKCLFKSYGHCTNWAAGFLTFALECFLNFCLMYILDTSLVSNTQFSNIFSQFMNCHFILLGCLSKNRSFNFDDVQTIELFFHI